MSNNHQLRFSETNSSDDSKGRTWGLDGQLFWYVLGGAFVAVALFLLLFSGLKWSFGSAAAVAGVPLGLSVVYVFCLRQGRPPGFDRDLLDTFLNGRGFAPESLEQQPANPISKETDVY